MKTTEEKKNNPSVEKNAPNPKLAQNLAGELFSLSSELCRIKKLLCQKAGMAETGLGFDYTADIFPEIIFKRENTQLQQLCSLFRLSEFEKQLLLLCFGVEIDPEFGALYARLHGDSSMVHPTFGLALSVLNNPDWGALSPGAALRYWRLIEVGPGTRLTSCPLRIDETIMHYLLGCLHSDQRLQPLLEVLPKNETLTATQNNIADKMAALWQRSSQNGETPPVIVLCGNDPQGHRVVARRAAGKVGLVLLVMRADLLPNSAEDIDSLKRLWEREAALYGTVLLLDCGDRSATAEDERLISCFIESLNCWTVLAGRERRGLLRRSALVIELDKPPINEQTEIWRKELFNYYGKPEHQSERLGYNFNLSTERIRSVFLGLPPAVNDIPERQLAEILWQECRIQARPRLSRLIQRTESKSIWEDLVLAPELLELLRRIVLQVRQRPKVYEDWGFAGKGDRGLGISVLFAGVSGTGKTLAAEILANELALDLYRVDLSSVVDKYIGETEKNLRQVFDIAEEGGGVLLFDEADALFGKRSEVRDSHDRHANIEVSYLLQRIETFRGLAIMTTNLPEALDQAFLRRFRFIVRFPFPAAGEREKIWRKVLPQSLPKEGLDFGKLARLNISGGNIRNIALNAAFLAAENGNALKMEHLLSSARDEYTKLGRPLTDEEVRDWTSN